MRTQFSKLALAAGFGLALAFTFSCSSDNESGGGSGINGGSDKGNNIANYKTVVIDTQTWMAENLDYNVSGSKCYDNNNSNCATYGRLYDWTTAMALPSSCNRSLCASLVGAKHQGICPSGWHIPSDAEWTTLTDYVGSSSGTKLKSREGWNSNSYIGVPSGSDTYGFVALPGGVGGLDGSFVGVGYFGYWWSASEYSAYSAYYRAMNYDYEDVYRLYEGYKSSLRSVRCLQD